MNEPDAPFPIVTGWSDQPDLIGLGWERYGRLAAIKGAMDDLARDVVRHHVDTGGAVDHAVLQYQRWRYQEIGRSFEAAAEPLGVFDPDDPSVSVEFGELVLECEQRIGAVAVEARRRWCSDPGSSAATVSKALDEYRYYLAAGLMRAFDNQLFAASLQDPEGE